MDDRDKRHMGIMPNRPYGRRRRSWRRRRGYGQRRGGRRGRGRHSRAALIGAVVAAIVAATAITAVAMTMGPDWVRQYEEGLAIAAQREAERQAERQAEKVAEIHRLTNEARAGSGLPPLRQDAALDAIAQAHADDMADRNYFDHVTPEGLDPSDRAAMVGYGCGGPYIGIGENIAEGTSSPSRTVDLWLDSPGHRENIMDPTYTHLGVGVSTGYPYTAVQNFC